MAIRLPRKCICLVQFLVKSKSFICSIINVMLNRILVFSLGLLLAACAIPIGSKPKYPIEVFYGSDLPSVPFTELGPVEVQTKRKNLLDARSPNGRSLAGMNQEEKERLVYQLVVQAQETLNAQAVVAVDYKMEMTKDDTIYKVTGIAIKYGQN